MAMTQEQYDGWPSKRKVHIEGLLFVLLSCPDGTSYLEQVEIIQEEGV